MRFDTETILGTIDWAHATMQQYGAPSGYVMDAIMAKQVARFRGNPDLGRGHFARYLRGESAPSGYTVFDLDCGDSLATTRIRLPLYDILRVGMDGYRGGQHDRCVQDALLEVERRFQRRLTRYADGDGWMTSPDPNSRYGLDICTYSSSYALTVLLTTAMELQIWADPNDDERLGPVRRRPLKMYDPLVMGQRAFQCLVLAIAAGEFPVTYALVIVRVRQRILDQLVSCSSVLDTAAVSIEDAIHVGRQALQAARAAGRTRTKQRAWLRAWLNDRDNADSPRMTPAIASPAQAAESRAGHPVRLQLEAPSLGRHGHRHQLGRKAKALLARELDGYVVSDPPQAEEDLASNR